MADQRDRRAAVAALVKLTQVAASGQPLAGFYDEKQCHVIHRFTYLGRERMIWRIRQSNIRLAFYYGAKRLIFLADVFPKRRDRLTKAEKSALEAEVMAYIEAERGGRLVLFSAGDPATNS